MEVLEWYFIDTGNLESMIPVTFKKVFKGKRKATGYSGDF